MSDPEEYQLIPHYNPYTTLAYMEECDLNSECMRSCYDDMGESSPTCYDDHDEHSTKPVITPTSSQSSFHDDIHDVPIPFWYDNEETSHIQHIMIWYTHQLQLRMSYERIHGERSPLIFIGSIRRHVICSPPGTWRTLDIISTYTRDHVPLGFTMTPLSCDIAYRTTWDISDGMPIAIKKLSQVDHQHYIRHLDMTHPPSYLHAIPIFACDDFIYTCNHMAREMGYAGAQAHAIHVTAQLTGMPHSQQLHLSDEKQREEDCDAKYEDEDEYTHEYIPDDEDEEEEDVDEDEKRHDSDVTDSESESEDVEESRDSSSDEDLTTYRQAMIKDTFPSYKPDRHSPPHKHHHHSHKNTYHPKHPHHYKHTSTPSSKALTLQDNEFLTACGSYDDTITDSDDVDDNDVAALAASLGLGLGLVRKSSTSCTSGWESSFRSPIRS